jgi:hypothetical protein
LVSGGAANAGGAGGAMATGGNAAGGVANGGSTTGGTASGGASVVTSRGQTLWLTLTEDRASQGDMPNSMLEIDGRIYTTQDSCATVSYNPKTRCVTGILCEYYAGGYWGMAVQLDFRTMGSPTYDAIGVAWEITGSPTHALELWVLCMDPQYGSSCTTATCEVNGPPWGASTIGLTGTYYFADRVPDNWGGTEPPEYDPARVFAMQFKLPAVKVGATSFQYCIQRLGIIVPQ